MRRFTFLFMIAFLGGVAFSEMQPANAATPTPSSWVELNTPQDGAVLQGVVAITGAARGGGMQTAELSFAYPSDETGTWFFIAEIDSTATEFQIEWDTTAITDGTYNLRLKATYANGEVLTKFISNVRVRNYTPIETKTPKPTQTPATAGQTASPKDTPSPTPTLLPANPATVEKGDIFNALGVGLAFTGSLFALLGIYFGLKKTFQ
ncbi:MAG: hypothetical protein B5M51_09625 [Anaerolinea sp. 4484_236]|nr:MAG: hypothetical protein B5M51_09625 [Anaerolinea sp. 4484_236]RLD11302.1 MAG: hypothetical protein DRI56_01365 [Chloroflexota bacterium]